jgi:L-arabinose transport system substrate-binding protein
MFKKAFFGSLFVAAILITGCSSDTNSSQAGSTGSGGNQKPGDKVKIGYIVKSMADSWFKYETDAAKEEAAKQNCEVVVQEATTGDAVLNTIDTMGSQGVQALIICAPEVQQGPAIKAACDKYKIKLMAIDDRLVGADGKPMTDVVFHGISASKIGNAVGDAIVGEMKKRNWNPAEVGAMQVLVPGLETAQLRVDGAKEKVSAAGVTKIFTADWGGAKDVEAAANAANPIITRENTIKKWVIYSSNDDGVLGAVRSLTNASFKPEDIIGVGINGPLAAKEFAKGQPTGIVGSVALQPKKHGGESVKMMKAWVLDGKEPAKETYEDGVFINKDNYKEVFKELGLPLD